MVARERNCVLNWREFNSVCISKKGKGKGHCLFIFLPRRGGKKGLRNESVVDYSPKFTWERMATRENKQKVI